MFHPPADNKVNVFLGWITRPVPYSAVIISFWSSDEHTSNSKQDFLWQKTWKEAKHVLNPRKKGRSHILLHCTCWTLQDSATRDGGQRYQLRSLTILSPATSARWIQPACPWSPSIPGSSLNVNVREVLWPEAYNHSNWLLWAWMSRHFLSWLTLLSRLTPTPLLAFFTSLIMTSCSRLFYKPWVWHHRQ